MPSDELWDGRGRPPSYPSLHVPIPIFLSLLSYVFCALRPSPYRKLLFIPYTALALFYVFHIRTSNLVNNFSQAGAVAQNVFTLFDLLVLTDVQRVLSRKGKTPKESPIHEKGFWERLKWSFSLVTSIRGVGWSHEPTAILPKPTRVARTRPEFLFQSALTLVQSLGLYILADIAMMLDPAFQRIGPSFHAPDRPWYLRPTVLAYGLAGRAIISAVYTIAASVSVGLGWTEPGAWPPYFGEFKEAWSVQRFWGRVWHQGMRRVSTSISVCLLAIGLELFKSAP